MDHKPSIMCSTRVLVMLWPTSTALCLSAVSRWTQQRHGCGNNTLPYCSPDHSRAAPLVITKGKSMTHNGNVVRQEGSYILRQLYAWGEMCLLKWLRQGVKQQQAVWSLDASPVYTASWGRDIKEHIYEPNNTTWPNELTIALWYIEMNFIAASCLWTSEEPTWSSGQKSLAGGLRLVRMPPRPWVTLDKTVLMDRFMLLVHSSRCNSATGIIEVDKGSASGHTKEKKKAINGRCWREWSCYGDLWLALFSVTCSCTPGMCWDTKWEGLTRPKLQQAKYANTRNEYKCLAAK